MMAAILLTPCIAMHACISYLPAIPSKQWVLQSQAALCEAFSASDELRCLYSRWHTAEMQLFAFAQHWWREVGKGTKKDIIILFMLFRVAIVPTVPAGGRQKDTKSAHS